MDEQLEKDHIMADCAEVNSGNAEFNSQDDIEWVKQSAEKIREQGRNSKLPDNSTSIANEFFSIAGGHVTIISGMDDFRSLLSLDIVLLESTAGKEVSVHHTINPMSAIKNILSSPALAGKELSNDVKEGIISRIYPKGKIQLDQVVCEVTNCKPSSAIIIEVEVPENQMSLFCKAVKDLESIVRENKIRLYLTTNFIGMAPFNPEISVKVLTETSASQLVAIDYLNYEPCLRLFNKALVDTGNYKEYKIQIRGHSLQVIGCEERRISFLIDKKPEFVNADPEDFPPLEDESEGEDGVACAEPRMRKSQGFIAIGRPVFESPYFVQGHAKYSYWLFDLYGQAEFKDITKPTFKYHKPIKLKRGQYFTAFRYLAKRWGVSTNKVRTFLNNMQDVGQIETHHESSGTIITLLHYGGCESKLKSTETQNETQIKTEVKRS